MATSVFKSTGKVLITDGVHPMMIDAFKAMHFKVDYNPAMTLAEVHSVVHQYEGLIINSKIIIDESMVDKAINLKFIGRLGSGMEIINQPYAKSKGIAVYNSPSGNCNAVAEHAMGMLLALSNNLMKGNREVKANIWEREANRGFELKGKTVGIIGFGHTGRAFTEKLAGFDVKVLAYDKYKSGYTDDLPYVEELDDLTRMFEETDVISFHLPLTEECIGYANQSFFDQFKKEVVVINTSRGKVIPTDVLINTLESGQVFGACLDVFENEKPLTYSGAEYLQYEKLFSFNQVIVTPHVAGWTVQSKYNLAAILVDKVKQLYEG